MARSIDKLTVEEIVPELVQGTLDINLLDLRRSNQRKAFLQAIKERRALLAKINSDNAPAFLGLAIDENFEYFVQLNRAQYTNGLAQKYLWGRLTKGDKGGKKGAKEFSNISVAKSLDERIVFSYSYVTPDGEELFYYDKELAIPLAMKSSIKLSIKLVDALALIEKLDTHITQLGENKIKTTINDLVANRYKVYLSEFIAKNEIGYYTLCTAVGSLEEGFKEALNEVLAEYGLVATEFYVKKLAIPAHMQQQIEDLEFKIRQRRTEVEADAEFSKLSLEGYEAKLALMQKYPGTEFTLTEYEKDQALARYLEKLGRKVDDAVDHSITLQQRLDNIDAAVRKDDDIIPDAPEKPNIFKRVFIAACALAAFIAILVMANAGFGPGVIVLLVAGAILGVVGFMNKDKLAGKQAPITTESSTISTKADDAFGGSNNE